MIEFCVGLAVGFILSLALYVWASSGKESPQGFVECPVCQKVEEARKDWDSMYDVSFFTWEYPRHWVTVNGRKVCSPECARIELGR